MPPSKKAMSPSTPKPRRLMPCRRTSSVCRCQPKPGKACYVPLAHVDGEGDLLGGGGLLPDQIPLKEALEVLKPMLEDRSVLKIAQNLKYDWLVMTRLWHRYRPL